MTKINTIICANCGSDVPITDSCCRYCSTPIKTGRKLSDNEKEKLSAVIRAMEVALKSSAGQNWIAGISFLILSVLGVALFFLYNKLLSSTLTIVLLTVFSSLVLFLFLGFIITLSDSYSYDKSYKNDIKIRINEYLLSQDFSRYQFDILADSILKKKSVLRRFLFKN